MKKYLLVTSLLAASASAAHADVTLSGDARMGFSNYDSVAKAIVDPIFSSRVRVRFNMSGETDSGLKFSAQFRASDATKTETTVDPTKADIKGTVSLEYPGFGKVTMGDAEGAAQAAMVQFAPIGYDETNKVQEFTFLTGGDASKGTDFLYTYTSGLFAASVSMGNPGAPDGKSSVQTGDDFAIGAAYTTEFWKVAAGFEDNGENTQTVLSGSYGNGQAEVKVAYGMRDDDKSQLVVQGNYIIGTMTLTAFYRDDEIKGKTTLGATTANAVQVSGIGATYDLGSGLAVSAGYAKEKGNPDAYYNVGLTMSF